MAVRRHSSRCIDQGILVKAREFMRPVEGESVYLILVTEPGGVRRVVVQAAEMDDFLGSVAGEAQVHGLALDVQVERA